ncbi:putative uncharacterized protein DDB_G0282499 [Vanessa cardui]|uniref:putative uncharacterized protein DDB_G0282499 n=1 Tax=Vanessa cardui TaxID=171605 RepID=UPI001F134725|nr:putative uncharacterized protein DDB_G0282499 [Vanessa cardui]
MYEGARSILFIYLILNLLLFISANDLSTAGCRSKRHLFPLLGYLQGYKIGHNFALHLPPFVLSPIIILPSVNQQQSVNVQKSSSDENYQENGGTFQNISPAKLVATEIEANDDIQRSNESLNSKNNSNIENVRYKSNDDPDVLQSGSDSFRQANVNETSATETPENIDELITTTPFAETTETEIENLIINSTKPLGPYPNASYNNEYINTLSITVAPTQYNLTLPNADDKWQNFSQPTNDSKNNNTINNINTTMDIVFPSTEMIKTYPYPRSWYNSKVDRLSITTNSYTNEEAGLPPTYDDRWQRFSSLRKSYPSSGFRPLAGLYYDGFLHKSLTKEMGFIPYRHNGYYYN